jgi:hypothetical protein
VRVYYSDGAAGTFTLDEIAVPVSPTQGLGVDLGDLDGDGDLDFVYSGWDNTDDFIYYNEGDTDNDGLPEFTAQLLNTGDSNLESQLFDMDQDGDLDVVMGDYYGGVTLYLNDGGRNFTQVELSATLSYSFSIAVGDIDGDGDGDIVQISTGAGSSRLLTNLGDIDNDGIVDFTEETLLGSTGAWDGGFINSDDFFIF